MRKTLPQTDPNYPRFVQIALELTQHRKAMRSLKKERDALLGLPVQATRAARGTQTAPVSVPAAPETLVAPPAAAVVAAMPTSLKSTFSAVPAGAPRTVPGQQPAQVGVYAQVRAFFETHPGVVHSAATVATALGLGQSLQRPVGEAIKKLAKEKLVTEMARGKYAHVHVATAAEIRPAT